LDTLQTISAVLGWCTVLNLGMLAAASLILIAFGDAIRGIHGGMFRMSDEDLSRAYFQYLAQYKIAIFVFNLAPWLALELAQ